jgi:DNA polymerase I
MDNLVLDLETTGLSKKDDKILLGGFKLNEEPTTVSAAPFTKEVQRLLSSPEVRVIGHNILFDISFLEKYGYKVRGPIIDTRVLAFARWPYNKLKLKALGKEILKKEVIELKAIKGRNKVEDIDPSVLEGYLRQDVSLTYELFRLLWPYRTDWSENVEIPLTNCIRSIQERGMYIDVPRMKELHNEWLLRINELVTKYSAINLNSPKQVKEFLEQAIGGRVRSTDRLSLIDIQDRVPQAKDILEYRGLSTLVNRYTRPFIQINGDSRIYGDFNQVGTKTGRLSSSKPNLQNIPSRSPNGKRFRECFVSPPGKAMIVGDVSQIEPRLVAFFTGDPTLTEIFAKDQDFHGIVTKSAYGKDTYTPEERFVGKTLGLATLYGAGTHRLQGELRKNRVYLSVKRVEELKRNILSKFPTVSNWIKGFEGKARYDKFFVTYGGRRVPYNEDVNMFNSLIQGSCGDYIKMVILNLEERGYEVTNTVHDEIISYVDRANGPAARSDIEEIMRTTISLGKIPIKVEVSIVNNWGEK